MSDLPILTALADVVSLALTGKVLPASSPSGSSSSSSPTRPVQVTVVPGAIRPVMQVVKLRPIMVKPRLQLGPPGWLGAVTQYGQLVQSAQLDYLLSHTDFYWDASMHQGAPRYEIDDRTSSKVLAIGHREPPCPWVPVERKRPWAGAEITRSGSGPWMHWYTGSRAGQSLTIGNPVTWVKALKLFGERWQGDKHWLYRFDLVDSPATAKMLRADFESPELRNAVWLFWAVEAMRVKLAPGQPPTWWLRALAHWGLLASACNQSRKWDLACSATEPWEKIARRLISIIGMPGERNLRDPKAITTWHPKIRPLGPLRTWAPVGMDWTAVIKQAQDAEYNESGLGQAAKYTNMVIGVVFSALSAYTGPVLSWSWAVAQRLQTISSGDLSSIGGLVLDVVEQFGNKYVGELQSTQLVSELTKVANGIVPGDINAVASSAANAVAELQSTTDLIEEQWGWAIDVYGGGVASIREIPKNMLAKMTS